MYSAEFCKLIIGTALSSSENGLITFIDNENEFGNSEYDFQDSAIIVGDLTIKEKDTVVSIQGGDSDADDKYCIGIIPNNDINDLTDPRLNDELENIPIKSKKGKSKFFINDKTISLTTTNSNITLDGEVFEVDIPNTKLKLNNSAFGLIGSNNERVITSIIGGEKRLHLFNEKAILAESKEMKFRINDGNLIITGKRDKNYSGTDEIEQYESLNAFVMKARTMDFISQGSGINFNAGHLGIQLGSSKFSSYTPGAGPSEAFFVNAIQGNLKLTTGLGNIELQTNNLEFINKINLRCGSIIHPTASGLEMDALLSRLYLNTVYEGINSELVFNTGGFTELNSFMDIGITSSIGAINISGLVETVVEGILAAKLKGMMVDILGDAMVNIESQVVSLKGSAVLDLSGSGTIIAGPKMAPPTGLGPFCALPTCLFTGAPHTGSTCS
jgi:hypothetical protein